MEVVEAFLTVVVVLFVVDEKGDDDASVFASEAGTSLRNAIVNLMAPEGPSLWPCAVLQFDCDLE